MHTCDYVQLYTFIYYTDMFRSLLCPSSGYRTVRIQVIRLWLDKMRGKNLTRFVSTDFSKRPILQYHKFFKNSH
jgi:hypothetical protein